MKKFIFVILVIAAIGYFKWDVIIAKKEEMKLKSFRKEQDKFWKKNKSVEYEAGIKEAFKKAEKGILDQSINAIEYQAIVRLLKNMSLNQKVDRGEITNFDKQVDKYLTENIVD
ncbi:MAG: hypothetical protein B6244_12000 [Candidatus Cloacimonetes bacterium 4572_55]|nr:MAG: hypothetical protein B6244_12000 [Candidatus Cloacimonetes bacterium 4572_55]